MYIDLMLLGEEARHKFIITYLSLQIPLLLADESLFVKIFKISSECISAVRFASQGFSSTVPWFCAHKN
jgi:hypothetical protein